MIPIKSRNFAVMKALKLLLYPLCVFTLLSACKDKLPAPDTMEAERTVIIYMMAENSLNRFSANDINEIRQAYGNIPQNTNLIVYVDNSSLPVIYNVTAKKGFVEWKTYAQDQISTDSTVMQRTLKEITTKFPAKHYGLVLWSHGSGWVPQKRSIGIDNGQNTSSNSGLQMNIPTLRGVLETLPHMEFILFDACAMQSIEVAYELRNVTDYIIGSPTEIHAEGAPYDMILGPMMRGDVLEVVKQYYATYQSWDGVVISLLDCRKMEAFAQATAKVMPQFSETIKTNGVEGIQIYQPYSSQTEWKPEPFDMEGAMHHTLDSASFAEWKTALDQILLYKNATSSWTSVFSGYSHCHLTDPDHYAALSIFLPHEKYTPQGWNENFRAFQWYKAAGWDKTGW